MTKPYKVLFLCTGNSARSILAEAPLNRLGGARFRAFSAGSRPAGKVHPIALDLLQQRGFDITGLRSKTWSEFGEEFSRDPLDFVFTVCDSAAAEVCPVWPGQPLSAHWGVPDPAAVEGSEAERQLAFATAFRQMKARIEAFVALPDLSTDRLALTQKLRDIGQL